MVLLANRLHLVDVEPIVGCLAPPGPLNAELELVGIETFSCEARGPADLTCLKRLAGHVRRIRPDLIHSSLFHANVAARLVGRLDRPRPIITSTVTIEIERPWHRWLEALTCGWSDLHVANSTAVAEHVCVELGFPPGRVVVLPNGVDIQWMDQAPRIDRSVFGLEEETPLIVWAGRMEAVKDLRTFVEVIALLKARMKIQAVLLGDGPERHSVEEMIRLRGLGGVISLSPWSNNIAGWLKSADLLLFPSRTEGSPNVVIEALCCGCPVVASDLSATRELIDPGVHGLLCRVGDVAGFARVVLCLLGDEDRRLGLSTAARRRAVARHDIQDIVYQWQEIYDRVMYSVGRRR
jgi:glycosyltransferase involved in cell wall biosynthesis